jgi:hypothetical protein
MAGVAIAGSTLEIDAGASSLELSQIDSTHYLCTYAATDNHGQAVVLSVDTGTWAVALAAGIFEFDSTRGTFISSTQVDATHYLIAYSGTSTDGYSVILEVNTGTWAITAPAASFVFDAVTGLWTDVIQVDATHYLVGYSRNTGGSAWAIVLAVNTGTWAITAAGAATQVDSASRHVQMAQIDATHYLFVHEGPDADGFAFVLSVNTGTWAVAVESTLEFAGAQNVDVSRDGVLRIDATHFLVSYSDLDASIRNIEVFAVDADTWAISQVGTPLQIGSTSGFGTIARIGATDYWLATWTSGTSLIAGLIEVNSSTWAVTQIGSTVVVDSGVFSGNEWSKISAIDATHFLVAYRPSSGAGNAVVIDVTLPVPATFSPKTIVVQQ